MIEILSASFGGYDDYHQAPRCSDIDACVMVTDDYKWLEYGWAVITRNPTHLHPRVAAKLPKCRPDQFTEQEEVVWMDASARIIDMDAFVDAVESIPDSQPMGQFVHPDRDCIYDEADVSEPMPKYLGQDVQEQVDCYRTMGHPKHWGLWATGMIVYHPRVFDVEAFGNEWLYQQAVHTYQDQLSEPHLLRRAGYRPWALPGNLRSNGYVEWAPHTRND